MGIGGKSKDGKGENAMRSGITRRWLRGSLLITVLLVLLVIFRLTGLSRRRRYGRNARSYSRGYRGRRHR